MVVIYGGYFHEMSEEADYWENQGEEAVICFTLEALFRALRKAESEGATVVVVGDRGERATLVFESTPCRLQRLPSPIRPRAGGREGRPI